MSKGFFSSPDLVLSGRNAFGFSKIRQGISYGTDKLSKYFCGFLSLKARDMLEHGAAQSHGNFNLNPLSGLWIPAGLSLVFLDEK